MMQSLAETPEKYIESLPDDRKQAIVRLRNEILTNLPTGFEEVMQYGMLSYVVPHSIYPNGYHCTPNLPLPFVSLASQKNHISLYHMALYAGELLEWLTEEWPKHSSAKLDMGKSCIRMKKVEKIPFELLGELCSKITPDQWIETYERQFLKK